MFKLSLGLGVFDLYKVHIFLEKFSRRYSTSVDLSMVGVMYSYLM